MGRHPGNITNSVDLGLVNTKSVLQRKPFWSSTVLEQQLTGPEHRNLNKIQLNKSEKRKSSIGSSLDLKPNENSNGNFPRHVNNRSIDSIISRESPRDFVNKIITKEIILMMKPDSETPNTHNSKN
jgi:hypothetical protein